MQEQVTTSPNKKLPFVPVNLQHQELVNRYMKPYGGNSCQHSFVNLFTMAKKYDSCICERDGFLLILRKGLSNETERVYLAPIGSGDMKAAYEALLADAKAHRCKAIFQTVTLDQVVFLKNHFPGVFEYFQLRDYAEYIYDTARLCTMSGGMLSKKRNKINQLLRLYGDRIKIQTISKDIIQDIWNYEETWLKEAAEDHDEAALNLEKEYICLQLDHFDELGLSGVGIYIDDVLEAFAYGVPLNDECYDGLIAKANRKIKNLYKLLYREISRNCAFPYPYFNWEEDVGVQGLRNMKMEYGPIVLMRKYLVRERDKPSCESEPQDIPVLSSIDIDQEEMSLPNSIPVIGQKAIPKKYPDP